MINIGKKWIKDHGEFPPRPAGYLGEWPKTIQEVEDNRTPWLYVEPCDHIGPCSIDVTLQPILKTYREEPIDPNKIEQEMDSHEIPSWGFVLEPGKLYLGATNEKVWTRDLVPNIDGRSSIGRCGISIHVTAGKGDPGFCGTFTLEIWAVQPAILYPDMRLGQLIFEPMTVHPLATGPDDYRGRYQDQYTPTATRYAQ